MKKHLSISATLILLFFLMLNQQLLAQSGSIPRYLLGVDLKNAQREFLQGINQGIDTLVIYYAEALFYDGNLKEAVEMYQKAEELKIPLDKYQKRNFTHAAIMLGEESPYMQYSGYFSDAAESRVFITEFCNNSPNEDFAPLVWNDLVYIASSRIRSESRYAYTRLPFLNIYAFDQACKEVNLDFLPGGLNTALHDGPVAIARDTSLVIINRNYEKPNKNGVHNLYLDYYVRRNNAWSRKQKFPLGDPAYSLQHPFYDDNNNTLYFSSDIPGGYGGFDIYKSFWNGQQWSNPVNLGPQINSSYDEVFPSISPEGHLIYASNHIETGGGLDLVMYKNQTRYLFPEPFNTPYDDFAISYLTDSSGYFSSNRSFSGFGDNIYYFEFLPAPEHQFLVKVLDKVSLEPVHEVEVIFQADEPPVTGQLLTSEQGEALLYRGTEDPFLFRFDLEKEGYMPLNVVSDEFIREDNSFTLTLLLERILTPAEEAIAQGYFEVYFDNDHPDPRTLNTSTSLNYQQTYEAFKQRWPSFYQNSSSSQEELSVFFEKVERGMQQLEWLASFLKDELAGGRHYTIIFTSHASPLARSEYNMNLSKRRFASVENYIMLWNGEILKPYIESNALDYANASFGSNQARPGVSDNREDPSRSIYSVEASFERRVTISWRRSNDDEPSAKELIQDIEEAKSVDTPEIPQLKVDIAEEESPVATTVSQARYHIIIGSFRNMRDAEQYVQSVETRGVSDPVIMPPTPEGHVRISHSSHSSEAEAEAVLRIVKQTLRADAWLLPLEPN